MGVLPAAQTVLRDLGARDDQHAVLLEGALRFGANVLEVVLEVLLTHAEGAAPERGEPAGAGQQILLHQDVIGDRDHVEFAGGPIEVDDLGHR